MSTLGRNAKLVKVHNQALVLRIIQQQEAISRKEIASLTGLTQATITNIANTLLENKLITETGKDENSNSYGRKPILLAINRDQYKIISVYIGRHIIQGALCDLSGKFLYKIEEYKAIYNSKDVKIENEIIQFLRKLITSADANLDEVLGIGISAPGPINAKKGILLGTERGKGHESPAPFDWRNVSLKEVIQDEFGVKVYADNEANVLALAESWFGKGVGINNFVLYSVGIGIGAGIIIDGMLYRGEDDVVAEVGHITIDFNGEKCICGNVGCLEHYASLKTMLQNYKRKISNNDIFTLPEMDNFNVITEIERVFSLAYEGEPTALSVVADVAQFLGIGAVSLANTFSPEYIIISGNDAGNINFDILLPRIRERISERAFSAIADKVTVLSAELGKENHLFGGVALVLQDFFNNLPESGAYRSKSKSIANK
jgi:predicted NBD/HSP70 family sugar kinase